MMKPKIADESGMRTDEILDVFGECTQNISRIMAGGI